MMLHDVLGRFKWAGQLGNAEITFIHRGVPGDRKTVQGSDVTGLDKSYFYYRDHATGRETTIPLHRVTEVRLNGELVWKKAARR